MRRDMRFHPATHVAYKRNTMIIVIEPDYYPMNEKLLDIGLEKIWRKVGEPAGGKPHK